MAKPACFTREENGRGHFYGHPKISADMADGILRRLKAPTALREDVVFLCDRHMVTLEPDPRILLRRLNQHGEERLRLLLPLQRSDLLGTGTRTLKDAAFFDDVEEILRDLLAQARCFRIKHLAVKGNDLMALGLKGRAIGQTLQSLLEQVMEGKLPNEKEALLNAIENP